MAIFTSPRCRFLKQEMRQLLQLQQDTLLCLWCAPSPPGSLAPIVSPSDLNGHFYFSSLPISETRDAPASATAARYTSLLMVRTLAARISCANCVTFRSEWPFLLLLAADF